MSAQKPNLSADQRRYAIARITEIKNRKISSITKNIIKLMIKDKEMYDAIKNGTAKLLPFDGKKSAYISNWFQFPLQKKHDEDYKKALAQKQASLDRIHNQASKLLDLISLGDISPEAMKKYLDQFEKF